jgi:hypothetical protein
VSHGSFSVATESRTTGDDVRDVVENIGDELSDLRDQVSDVAPERVDEVESALEVLRSTLEGLGERPLSEASSRVTASACCGQAQWGAAMRRWTKPSLSMTGGDSTKGYRSSSPRLRLTAFSA